jgi:hypothetical protein
MTFAPTARPMSTPALKSGRYPLAPSEAVSRASRAAIACSSFGKKNASTVAAAPAAAPSGFLPCDFATTIALLIARFVYASVRSAGNWPAWLRAIRSHAYSFQLTVDVGAAHGEAGAADIAIASVRAGCCAQPLASTAVTSAITTAPKG